jgi:cyanophycinase-like exopeptidase
MDAPLAHARLGLVGSGEFTPAMEDVDREILATIGADPHVVILPTAAAGEDPHDWASRGVAHFQRLGAKAEGLMVLNWAHADDPEVVDALAHADLVYMSGGKPARLLSALEGSALFGAMLRVRRDGGWIVGSSAGAMVLGDWTLVHAPGSGDGTPTTWTIGLGILQGMAVVPHYDRWVEADALAGEIEASCTVFGIAEDTAFLMDEGHGRVLGATASCVRNNGATRWIQPGERFELA